MLVCRRGGVIAGFYGIQCMCENTISMYNEMEICPTKDFYNAKVSDILVQYTVIDKLPLYAWIVAPETKYKA
jgi:hypothetical protein